MTIHTPSIPPRAIAITGAQGLVGRALCEYFARRGSMVRALTRRPAPDLAALPNISVFTCDLPDQIDAASLHGCDAVIHAAYSTRYRSLDEARHINEAGTRRLLELSRQAGVPRFVFVSTTSAHAEARSYYGQSKHRLEALLDHRRDLVIRPGLVLSSTGGLFRRMIGGGRGPLTVPLFAGGRQPMQTIHIDDLCEGFGLAIDKRLTGSLTLASPEHQTMREFFTLVAARLNRQPRFIPLPIGPAILGFRLAEALRVPLPVTSENLLGLLSLRHLDNAANLERLGLRVRSTRESLAALPLD